MRHPIHRPLAALLAASVALLAVVGPAAAGAPQQVTIVSTMTINFPDPNTGTFETSGSDLICTSGTVLDTRLIGDPSRANYDILVNKTFTCDGGGTILVRLQAHGSPGVEVFTWVILGGTGAYANLHGQGDGTTTFFAGAVVNTYTGFLVG